MPPTTKTAVHLAAAVAVAAAVITTPAAGAATTSAPRPGWKNQIARLAQGHAIGISVREEGEYLYRRQDIRRRTPASNQKLLLAMALLDRLGPEARMVTVAAGPPVTNGVVPGNLWILGHGDPAVRPERLRDLARAVRDAGVIRVEGSVIGSTGYFKRDWRAPGWKSFFPLTEIPLPTALTYEGNVDEGAHIRDPELRAAEMLTKRLRAIGLHVGGAPGAGKPPAGLVPVAEVQSRPLIALLEYTCRFSSNFYAEVLGKRLGVEQAGPPGSIAKGAAGIRAWAARNGVGVRARDASGLSYANRLSPSGLVRLLGMAEDQEWGEALREALPHPGQGTLKGRLRHVPVHAKTGTLSGISALSGWVYLRHEDVWAEFSMLSRGMSKDQAVRIEDRIVRILWRRAS